MAPFLTICFVNLLKISPFTSFLFPKTSFGFLPVSLKEALLNALVKELNVELPKSLIDLEVRNIVEQTAQNFAQQGMDVKSMFTKE